MQDNQQNEEKISALLPDLKLEELQEVWLMLTSAERIEGFSVLSRLDAEDFFLGITSQDQAQLLSTMPDAQKRSWVRILPPDDIADVIQKTKQEDRQILLNLLDEPSRKLVLGLMAYAEDEAGGLMNPLYVRLRPEMTADEAISYLRRQIKENVHHINYAYVLDSEQHLLGVISFSELLSALPSKQIFELMHQDLITTAEQMEQEALSLLFKKHHLLAIPVVDSFGVMKGVVTVDDIVEVEREEATEDIQKVGGTEALDEPYLQIAFSKMIRKRAGWLMLLFIGEMFTATAMSYYEDAIAKAVVLALFIPLIISSGGNSGSQACTLVIRAMALGEIRLRDWWRVFIRELGSGLVLGSILASIGLMRIILWPTRNEIYGEHYFLIACTVAASLMGVVLWGTITGSMLPFLLRRLKLDPASASAPFVATLVDVTGLIIYFSVANLLLKHILL